MPVTSKKLESITSANAELESIDSANGGLESIEDANKKVKKKVVSPTSGASSVASEYESTSTDRLQPVGGLVYADPNKPSTPFIKPQPPGPIRANKVDLKLSETPKIGDVVPLEAENTSVADKPLKAQYNVDDLIKPLTIDQARKEGSSPDYANWLETKRAKELVKPLPDIADYVIGAGEGIYGGLRTAATGIEDVLGINPNDPIIKPQKGVLVENPEYVSATEKKIGGGLDILNGLAHAAFSAISLTPEGAAFMTGAELAPEPVTSFIFSPASNVASLFGYQPKEGSLGSKALTTGDIIGSLAVMGGVHKALGEKLINKEPLTAEEIPQVQEVLKNATPSDITKVFEENPEFKKQFLPLHFHENKVVDVINKVKEGAKPEDVVKYVAKANVPKKVFDQVVSEGEKIGEITPEKAAELKKTFEEVQKAKESVGEHATNPKIVALATERAKLEEEKAALIKPLQERKQVEIDAIDEKIKNASGVKIPEKEVAKPKAEEVKEKPEVIPPVKTEAAPKGEKVETKVETPTTEVKVNPLVVAPEVKPKEVVPQQGEKELQISGDVVKFPVSEVGTDVKRFQNREKEYSENSVDKIVENFDENKLDPIVLWKDPSSGKAFVLSGHSRLEAHKRLGKEDIKARYFKGTEAEASAFAKQSNVLGTRETNVERAAYYKEQRDAGKSDAEIQREAKQNEGENKTKILSFSYLNPKGKLITALKSISGKDVETEGKLEKAANWIGDARRNYEELTDAHEAELYDWLINKGALDKIGNKTEFNVRIGNIAEAVKLAPEEPLNIENRITRGALETEAIGNRDVLAKEIKDLEKERKTASTQRLGEIATEIEGKNKELGRLNEEIKKAREADKNQVSLFDQINEEVNNKTIADEKASEFLNTSAENATKRESIIADIESKAESTSEVDLNEAIRKADELIGEEPALPSKAIEAEAARSETKEPSSRATIEAELGKATSEMNVAQVEYDKATKALSKDLGAKQTGMFEGAEQKLFEDTPEERTAIKEEIESRKKALDTAKEKVSNLSKRLGETLEGQTEIDLKKDLKDSVKNLKDKFNDLLGENQGIASLPEAEAKKMYDFHVAVVDVARKAIKYGVKSASEFAKTVGTELTDAIKRAWDSATSLEKGLEDEVRDFSYFTKEAGEKVVDETSVKDPEMTKMANAINDAYVEGKFGIEALDSVLAKLQDTDLTKIYEEVKSKIKSGAIKVEEVRKKVMERQSGSEQDQAVILYDAAELKGKESLLLKQINETVDIAEKGKLQSDLIKVQDDMMDNALANRSIGRSASSIFRLRQLWVDNTANLTKMMDEFKASKGLDNLSPEQEIQVKATYNKLRELEAKMKDLRESEQKTREENIRLEKENEALTAIKEDVEKHAEVKEKRIKEASKRIATTIRKGKLSRPGVFSAATPASLVWDGAIEVAAKTVEAGGTVAQAVVDGIAHIKASEWYKKLTDEKKSEAEGAYADFIKGKEETTEGKVRIPKSIIRDLVEQGVDNIEDLVTELRDALPEELAEKTDREIRDAVTNYGRTINMSKEQIDIDIRKMKRMGRLMSGLEDVRNQKRPLRSGLQRDKLDAEERAMQNELKELMKELPVEEGELEKKWKTALDAVKERLRNKKEDLLRFQQTGERAKKRPSVEYDNEVRELQAEVKKLADETGYAEKQWNEQRINTLERKRKEYEERISKGDFQIKKRISKSDIYQKSEELAKTEKEYAKTRLEWDAARRNDLMANRGVGEKIKDAILRWQRFAVLSYPSTMVKLLAVVGHGIVLKPFRFAMQSALYGITKMVAPSFAGKTRVYGKPHISSLAKYYSEFLRAFSLENLKEQFSGVDAKEAQYGKPFVYDEFKAASGWMEIPGRSHGYIKSFIKKPEFAYAHEQLVNWNIEKMEQYDRLLENVNLSPEQRAALEKEKSQYDVTREDVRDRMGALALEHGKWSILMNENKGVDAIRRWMDSSGLAGALVKSELPVLKIPINYIERAFVTKFGLLLSATGKKWGATQYPGIFELAYKGTKNLKPEEADLLARTIMQGTIGATMFTMGYLMQDEIKRDEKGKGWWVFGQHVSDKLLHIPEYESLFSGVETAKRIEEMKEDKSDSFDYIMAFVDSDIDLIKKMPFSSMLQYGFIGNMTDAIFQKDDDKKAAKMSDIIARKMSSMLEPGFIKEIAEASDIIPDTRKPSNMWFGEPMPRRPIGFSEKVMKKEGSNLDRFFQEFEMGIPGLRKNVPLKEMTPFEKKKMAAIIKEKIQHKEPLNQIEQKFYNFYLR